MEKQLPVGDPSDLALCLSSTDGLGFSFLFFRSRFGYPRKRNPSLAHPIHDWVRDLSLPGQPQQVWVVRRHNPTIMTKKRRNNGRNKHGRGHVRASDGNRREREECVDEGRGNKTHTRQRTRKKKSDGMKEKKTTNRSKSLMVGGDGRRKRHDNLMIGWNDRTGNVC